jgi:hypothetical protein
MSLVGAAQGVIGTAVVTLLFYGAYRGFMWQMGKVAAMQHRVTMSRQAAAAPSVVEPPPA